LRRPRLDRSRRNARRGGAGGSTTCAKPVPESSPQGQARHRPVHVRRTFAARPVRPQAGPGETRGRAAGVRRTAHGTRHRRTLALDLHLPQTRAGRHRRERASAESGGDYRRDLRRSFHLHLQPDPQPRAFFISHREHHHGSAHYGRLDLLRFGNGKRQPARFCGAQSRPGIFLPLAAPAFCRPSIRGRISTTRNRSRRR
jgi:hypothetical protein